MKPTWTFFMRACYVSLVAWQLVTASAAAKDHRADSREIPAVSEWDSGESPPDNTRSDLDMPFERVRGCCCGGCRRPSWSVRAGTILLARQGDSRQSFLFEPNEIGKPGSEIFNAQDFGSAWAGGPDLSILRELDSCRSIEARYFGIDGWTDRGTRTGDMFVVLPTATVPASGSGTFLYGSDLYSVEVNVRRRTNDWLTFLAGFRFVEFDESLLLQFAPPGGAPTDVFEIDTNNRLYGAQLGAEAAVGWIGRWRLDGWLKAGVYRNDIDQSTNLFIPVPGAAGARGDGTAFLGSVGLSAVRPVTDRLAFRAGYEALWLEGVALAPSQLGVTNVQNNLAGLDKSDAVFFHGFTVGLEAWW